MKSYYLYCLQDYRGNFKYRFELISNSNEDSSDEDILGYYGEFSISESNKTDELRIFLVGYNDIKLIINPPQLITTVSLDETDKGKQIMQQIHSHLNECDIFISKGFNGAGKEEGKYGNPIPVTHLDVQKLEKKDYDNPTVTLLVNSKGDILYHFSIVPYS